eukprot:5433534-Pyramimonas_sp.AAC.1
MRSLSSLLKSSPKNVPTGWIAREASKMSQKARLPKRHPSSRARKSAHAATPSMAVAACSIHAKVDFNYKCVAIRAIHGFHERVADEC